MNDVQWEFDRYVETNWIPLQYIIQHQSITLIKDLRKRYLMFHQMLVQWFRNQQLKYPRGSLICYQLYCWERCQTWLECLELGLHSFSLIPFLISQRMSSLFNKFKPFPRLVNIDWVGFLLSRIVDSCLMCSSMVIPDDPLNMLTPYNELVDVISTLQQRLTEPSSIKMLLPDDSESYRTVFTFRLVEALYAVLECKHYQDSILAIESVPSQYMTLSTWLMSSRVIDLNTGNYVDWLETKHHREKVLLHVRMCLQHSIYCRPQLIPSGLTDADIKEYWAYVGDACISSIITYELLCNAYNYLIIPTNDSNTIGQLTYNMNKLTKLFHSDEYYNNLNDYLRFGKDIMDIWMGWGWKACYGIMNSRRDNMKYPMIVEQLLLIFTWTGKTIMFAGTLWATMYQTALKIRETYFGKIIYKDFPNQTISTKLNKYPQQKFAILQRHYWLMRSAIIILQYYYQDVLRGSIQTGSRVYTTSLFYLIVNGVSNDSTLSDKTYISKIRYRIYKLTTMAIVQLGNSQMTLEEENQFDPITLSTNICEVLLKCMNDLCFIIDNLDSISCQRKQYDQLSTMLMFCDMYSSLLVDSVEKPQSNVKERFVNCYELYREWVLANQYHLQNASLLDDTIELHHVKKNLTFSIVSDSVHGANELFTHCIDLIPSSLREASATPHQTLTKRLMDLERLLIKVSIKRAALPSLYTDRTKFCESGIKVNLDEKHLKIMTFFDTIPFMRICKTLHIIRLGLPQFITVPNDCNLSLLELFIGWIDVSLNFMIVFIEVIHILYLEEGAETNRYEVVPNFQQFMKHMEKISHVVTLLDETLTFVIDGLRLTSIKPRRLWSTGLDWLLLYFEISEYENLADHATELQRSIDEVSMFFDSIYRVSKNIA